MTIMSFSTATNSHILFRDDRLDGADFSFDRSHLNIVRWKIQNQPQRIAINHI